MKSQTGWLVFSALLAVSGATAQTAAPPRDLVLEGGTLIDGTGRAPVPDAVIVVEGTRIKAVGRRGQIQVPANANVINLAGRTILPGLIDHHVHLQDWQLPMFLPYGVTTIADANNDTAWILAQREALQKGRIKGPRMFVAGAFIWGPLNPESNNWNTLPARTVEEARAMAHSRIADGVDIIKVDLGLTDEQLRAVVEVAKAAGMPVLGHTQNIRHAAAVGDQHEEHMDTMARAVLDPDEKMPPRLYPSTFGVIDAPQVAPEALADPKKFPPLIAFMVKQGVFVNPTLVAGWWASTPRGKEFATAAAQMIKDPGLGFVPAEVRQGWAKIPEKGRAGYDHVATFLREYDEAGGKVVVGTDTGFDDHAIPGLAVHNEMLMLVDTGIPPMKAIEGATLWNAQLLKKDKDLGSVEVGKLADFTVIQGNPLADISVTRNVRMVIKDGQVMDTRYDPHWVNPIPMPFSTETRPRVLITNLTPRTARQGGQPVTVQVTGTNFAPDAVVRFDNADVPTHFVSKTQLTATLDARVLRKKPAAYALYVVNPGAHGTVSSAGYFTVNFPQ